MPPPTSSEMAGSATLTTRASSVMTKKLSSATARAAPGLVSRCSSAVARLDDDSGVDMGFQGSAG
jgi:hypothetical protein